MRLLNPVANGQAILEYLRIVFGLRELTWEMTKREFADRYAGQMLGVLWGFAHPVLIILVYIFVFQCIFKARLEDANMPITFDFTVYILAGLIPWLASAEVMGKGTGVILGNSNLVKQVMFPVEVLPAKTVLATFLTEIILLAGLVLYILLRFHTLPWTLVLVPMLVGFHLLGMFGIALIFAALGTYFRDLKDFVQVFCTINIYLMPVVYLPSWVPEPFRPILYANPFSYAVWCYQDALYYGQIVHPWAWLIFALTCLTSLAVGYRLFSRLKLLFGNVL